MYTATYGGLAIAERGYWFKCRDAFHSIARPKVIYFRHPPERFAQIVAFMNHVEDRLERPQRLQCDTTATPGVMQVTLDEFWREPLRTSLLTALLRAALDHETLEDALQKNIYLSATKPAVERFLAGHTTCPFRTHVGWVEYFKAPEHLDQLL